VRASCRKAWDAELAEMPVFQHHVARGHGARVCRRRGVVEGAPPAAGRHLQALQPDMAAGVDAARDEERHADVGELAVREGRAGMADAAAPFTQEQAQAALCRQRVARGGAVARWRGGAVTR